MPQMDHWETLAGRLPGAAVARDENRRAEFAAGHNGSRVLPSAVIAPRNLEQLKAVVEWARAGKVPLTPVSSGGPHRRGTAGLAPEAGVVDLSALKKIISVNRRNRVALFEAGVTFSELIPAIRSAGLRPLLPLLSRPGKSALAAYLDREPIIFPKYQWDLADPLLCLELVFGTGDVFRTGSAAGPGTIEQQWRAGEYQKNPMGPGQNDWMRIVQGAQGTIGIATWASAKCEVWPQVERLAVATADRLEPLIEASYRLFYRKLTDIHFLLDANALVNLLAPGSPEREQARAKAKPWNLIYTVAGIEHFPAERAAYYEKEAAKEVQARGGRLGEPPLGSRDDLRELLYGVSSAPFWKDRPQGAHREVYFQTTLNQAGAFIARMKELAAGAGVRRDQLGIYLQPQLGGRCCHLEFIFGFDPEDAPGAGRVQQLAEAAAEPLISAGAFFSRPHGAWAKPAMAKAGTAFWIYARMKDIFDPDHILAPGRLGLGGAGHGQA